MIIVKSYLVYLTWGFQALGKKGNFFAQINTIILPKVLLDTNRNEYDILSCPSSKFCICTIMKGNGMETIKVILE